MKKNKQSRRQEILILSEHFSPAQKAGGIVRSLSYLVRNFSQQYQFYIICGDRDLGGAQTMEGVVPGKWTTWEDKADVMYLAPSLNNLTIINKAVKQISPDAIYVCGMYSLLFNLYPLYLKRKGLPCRMIIAPRGMLQSGALKVKPLKKKIYLRLFKLMGLHSRVIWHATDAQEVEDIRRSMGEDAEVILADVAPDLKEQNLKMIIKNKNELRLVFISLLTAKKNLKYLLECMHSFDKPASLDIFGPIKDKEYWKECEAIISQLPAHIKVQYRCAIHPDEVADILSHYHFFILPTLGENFGHAIYEALNTGRPVIVSNNTPWQNLQEKRAGWDFDLADETALPRILDKAASMEQATYDALCRGAQEVAREYVARNDFESQYARLFLGENNGAA